MNEEDKTRNNNNVSLFHTHPYSKALIHYARTGDISHLTRDMAEQLADIIEKSYRLFNK
jgi:hypothetical protein